MYRRQNNVTIAKSNLSDLLSVLNGRADIAHCSIVVVAVFIICFVLIFLLLLFFCFVFFLYEHVIVVLVCFIEFVPLYD